MSWSVSLCINPVWDSLDFLDLSNYFLPHFREVFNYYLIKYFLMAFIFVFFSWNSYDSNVKAFDIVPEVSEVVLISFNSLFPLCFIYFHHSIFHLSYPIFCLIYSTFASLQSVFSLLLHYSLLIDSFFISSRSLLNLSCIFTILVSRLFIYNSILFSRFLIIFTIIILNSFSGRFPISSSFIWFGGHLSCSFTC